MRRQRHAQKRSSSDSDGAPRVPSRFVHVLGALVGLGAGFGGAWGPRRWLYTILPLTLNEIVDWGSCGGAPLFDIKWRSGQETMPT